MESTGVYWMPVYEMLEAAGGFEILVVNAQHMKRVPGRKTDVKDAEWIADLVRHGLVRASFIPGQPFRNLRWLTRARVKLVGAHTSECNRLIKLLEASGLKLASVMSDVLGVSGRAMLWKIVEGETDVEKLAALARGVLRKKIPELKVALECRLGSEQRRTLRMHLTRLESTEAEMAGLEGRIRELLVPYAREMKLLQTIDGVDFLVAATLIAELGTDLSAFPTPHALAMWVGICPGNNESAGKRHSGRIPQGNRYLKVALVEGAHAAAHKKQGFLRDKFHRLRARCGAKCALVAIAHKLIKIVWHVLTGGEPYREFDSGHLDQVARQRHAQRAVRQLERLGYVVQITAAAPPTDGAAAGKVRDYELRPVAAKPAVSADAAATTVADRNTSLAAPTNARSATSDVTPLPDLGLVGSSQPASAPPTPRPVRKPRRATAPAHPAKTTHVANKPKRRTSVRSVDKPKRRTSVRSVAKPKTR